MAMVEAVIVLPVLIFLMMAAAEVTNVFIQHNTLTKSVRDGARFVADNLFLGSTQSMNLTTARIDDTKSMVVYGDTSGSGTPRVHGLGLNHVTVTALTPRVVQVTASYPYAGILGAVLPGIGGGASLTFNLSATVSMRAMM